MVVTSDRDPNYHKYHYKMMTKYGRPSLCDNCETTENRMYHWAHKHNASWDAERENWYRLCVPCHSAYDETYLAVAQANSERDWTPEMCEKMSESCRGEKNGFFGKKHTEETLEKLRETRAIVDVPRIVELYLSGSSLKQIAAWLDVSYTLIRDRLLGVGIKLRHRGRQMRYSEEPNGVS